MISINHTQSNIMKNKYIVIVAIILLTITYYSVLFVKGMVSESYHNDYPNFPDQEELNILLLKSTALTISAIWLLSTVVIVMVWRHITLRNYYRDWNAKELSEISGNGAWKPAEFEEIVDQQTEFLKHYFWEKNPPVQKLHIVNKNGGCSVIIRRSDISNRYLVKKPK